MKGSLRVAMVTLLILAVTGPASGAAPRAATSRPSPGRWVARGPAGGPVRTLAVSPAAPNTIWAGTRRSHSTEPIPGNAAVSRNGGRTWTTVRGLSLLPVTAMAADPVDPAVVYAATGSVRGQGVWRTRDGGATWQPTGPSSIVNTVNVDPTDHLTVYAGVWYGGVWISEDGGDHWSFAGVSRQNVFAVAADPATGVVLAGTQGRGVYRSTDGGQTWRQSNQGLGTRRVQVNRFAFGPSGRTFAATGQGVFTSDDDGATWTGSNLTQFTMAVDVSRTDPIRAYAATTKGGVWRTGDGGQTWTAANAGIPTSTILSLAVDPADGERALVGTGSGGGVFGTSEGGGSWRELDRGMAFSEVAAVAVTADDPSRLYAAGDDIGVAYSGDRGRSWRRGGEVRTNFVNALAADPTAADVVYVGTYDGVLKTTDGGQHWRLLADGPPESLDLAVAPSDPRVLYSAGSGLNGPEGMAKSVDAGRTWTDVSNGLGDAYSQLVEVDPTDPEVAYAGVGYSGQPVFKTNDGGASWTAASAGLPEQTAYDLEVSAADHRVVFVVVTTTLYRSVDGASTWTSLTGACGGGPVWSVAPDPTDARTVFVSAGSVVCRSVDGGATWTELPRVTVGEESLRGDLEVAPDGSALYLPTSTGGVEVLTDP